MQALFRFAPDQSGALWIGLFVTFFILGDSTRLFSKRNLIAALLFLPTLPLIDIHKWEPHYRKGEPFLLTAAFTGLFACTALMAAFALSSALRRTRETTINPRSMSLVLLALAAVFINVCVVFAFDPTDAGRYTNLGAQRWLETGTVPYSDAKLRGPTSPGHGAAATYGPVLYAAHMPFQLLLETTANPKDADPMDPGYRRPDLIASKLACLLFHLIGLFSLYGIGARLASHRVGWTLVALYAGSSYVIGMGGEDFEAIGGLTYISHIAPISMVLLAFFLLDRPFLAGAALAVGAGALFWPAFLFPSFLGWYLWRGRGTIPFLLGFGILGAAIAGAVIGCSTELDGKGPIGLFMSATLEHQEGFGNLEYGSSLFSFWGVYPEFASFWQVPLTGTSSVLKPTFIGFATLALCGFFLARKRNEAQFAMLLAAIGAAIQLWKTHAGGTYVEWYYPLVLIGLLCYRKGIETTERAEAPPAEETSTPAPNPTAAP